MAHEDYYYKYGDHMPDGTPDTRWQTAPSRWLNRGHDAAANILVGAMEGGKAIKDFVGNTTFNPLPYGDIANSAYEGIQNIYGNWLDDKYDAVADWYNPQPDMMAGGPLSRGPAYQRYVARNGWYNDDRYINHPDNADQLATRAQTIAEAKNYEDAYIPSHEIPGYDRMVNEGYDSWSPSGSYAGDKGPLAAFEAQLAKEKELAEFEAQLAENWESDQIQIDASQTGWNSPTYFPSPVKRKVKKVSDWQQWKDSFKSGWEAK